MKTVKEYVLYRVEGEVRIALFSDQDEDVVRAHKIDAVRDAHAAGQARPELVMTCRTCTYPNVSKTGQGLALDSTCDEADL